MVLTSAQEQRLSRLENMLAERSKMMKQLADMVEAFSRSTAGKIEFSKSIDKMASQLQLQEELQSSNVLLEEKSKPEAQEENPKLENHEGWEQMVTLEVEGDVERGQEVQSMEKICSAHQVFDKMSLRVQNRVWEPGDVPNKMDPWDWPETKLKPCGESQQVATFLYSLMQVVKSNPAEFKTFDRKRSDRTLSLEDKQDDEHEQNQVIKLISSLKNRIWEPGGVLIEHDKWNWLETCYNHGRLMRFRHWMSSMCWKETQDWIVSIWSKIQVFSDFDSASFIGLEICGFETKKHVLLLMKLANRVWECGELLATHVYHKWLEICYKHKWRSKLSHSFSEMKQRVLVSVRKSFGYLMETHGSQYKGLGCVVVKKKLKNVEDGVKQDKNRFSGDVEAKVFMAAEELHLLQDVFELVKELPLKTSLVSPRVMRNTKRKFTKQWMFKFRKKKIDQWLGYDLMVTYLENQTTWTSRFDEEDQRNLQSRTENSLSRREISTFICQAEALLFASKEPVISANQEPAISTTQEPATFQSDVIICGDVSICPLADHLKPGYVVFFMKEAIGKFEQFSGLCEGLKDIDVSLASFYVWLRQTGFVVQQVRRNKKIRLSKRWWFKYKYLCYSFGQESFGAPISFF